MGIINDRRELKRLVESYGKRDVMNYVQHINESKHSKRLNESVRNIDIDAIADIVNDCKMRCLPQDKSNFIEFRQILRKRLHYAIDRNSLVSTIYDDVKSYGNFSTAYCFYGSDISRVSPIEYEDLEAAGLNMNNVDVHYDATELIFNNKVNVSVDGWYVSEINAFIISIFDDENGQLYIVLV